MSFVPTRSGEYTVAVMLGTQLEVQNITADISSRTGYFTLQYGSCEAGTVCVQTKALSWTTDGVGMANALMTLPIGPVTVSYSVTSDRKTAAWAVTFLSACDMDQITAYGGTLPVTITETSVGQCAMVSAENAANINGYPYVNTYLVNEVQQIYVSCVRSCKYTLSFRGYTTISLSNGASAATIKAALEALETIGTVQVIMDIPGSLTSTSFQFTFSVR